MKCVFLKGLFSMCELLNGFDIRCGHLTNKCRSVSIVPDGDCVTIRSYSDGEKIVGDGFELLIRLPLSEDNSNNFEFLNSLSHWIDKVQVSDFISDTSPLKPVAITVTQGAKLEDDDIHSGKYTIKFRLDTIV